MQIIVVCIVLFAAAVSVSATVPAPTSYGNYCGLYGTPICHGCKCYYCYEYDPRSYKCKPKTSCSKNCGKCGRCVCNKNTGVDECVCDPGFDADSDCKTGPCKNNPCNYPDGGRCEVDLVNCGKTCKCNKCYEGKHCRSRKDDKGSAACKALGCKCGTCKCDEHRGLYCDCNPGFTGAKCDQGEVNSQKGPCSGAPCQNGGRCDTVYKNGQCTKECKCTSCYKGPHCNIHVCDHKDCGHCGKCECEYGVAVCKCYSDYWKKDGICSDKGPCDKYYHLCKPYQKCVQLAVPGYTYKCGYKCINLYR